MRILRRVAISLFLLTYLTCCFLTNQFRAARAARHVMRPAMSRHATQIIDVNSASSEDNYPRYREAKKVAFDFHFRSVAAVSLPSLIGKCEFARFELYWETHHWLGVLAVRAPPLQAQLDELGLL